MKTNIKIYLIAITFLLLVSPVSAQTLTFVDTTAIDEDSGYSSTLIYVYYGNGTLAGVLNSTNELSGLNSTQDYTLILKPNTITLFNNPEWVLNWVLDSWMLIFVVIFAVVIAFSCVGLAVIFVKPIFYNKGRRR